MKTSRNQVTIVIAAVVLLIAAVMSITTLNANATNDPEPCVPSDAWTETIEHPEVSHEETVVVVDEEAWTETIEHEATPDLWWNWSPNHQQGPFEGPPNFPTDERGTWQGPHENGGPSQDTYGTFQQGNGNGSWFHREHGEEAWTETIEHPEVSHTEVIVIVDEEAWTEVIEHPAITCDEQPEPLVTTASSTSYNCGDNFQVVTTTVTTTEYVEEDGEWVLGEPVVESTSETNPVPVVPCDNPDGPNQPTSDGQTVRCLGGALVTEKFDEEGNRISSSIEQGHPRCAPEKGDVSVVEEGM